MISYLYLKIKKIKRIWSEIPPRILHDLPDFKIGKLNKEDDIKEKKLNEERKTSMIERNEIIKENILKNQERREKEEKELIERLKDFTMEIVHDLNDMKNSKINMSDKCQHEINFENCDVCSYTPEEIQEAEQTYKRIPSRDNSSVDKKKMKNNC